MIRRPLALALAAAMASAFACSSERPPPFEALDHVFARRTTVAGGTMPAAVDEPGTYTIAFDRYAVATGTNPDQHHDVINVKGAKRRALNPVRLVRTVTRPFEETIKGGNSSRRLGFVNDLPNDKPRVVLLRPLADDFRPRVFPLPGEKQTAVYAIAGRRCMLHSDSKGAYCVDNAGLVLASDDGRTVDVATKITTNPATKDASAIAAPLAKGFTDPDAGSIRPISPASSPPGKTDYALAAPPDGFTFVGRYAVVALGEAVLARTSRKIPAGIVDVYVRGKDAIVVDRGGRLDTSDVTDDDLGVIADERAADLGPLGTARAGIGGISPFGYREVRFAPSQGRYVVVAGTVPLDELVALARSLRASPGSNLVYVDTAAPA